MSRESVYLSFENYEVEKINLNKTKECTNESEPFGLLFKVVPDKEKNFEKINVYQGISVEPSQDFQYKLEIVIKGNFTVNEGMGDDEKLRLISVNASAILFPYLRSLVSLVTSQLDYEKIILPVMNFHAMFDDADIGDIVVSPESFEEF
ncbi:preprotein translocase subunit SecB [Peptoclostridium litorale DSM 5388]|uniref:Preprotein translocase subunit SecB n=1 Tax=Peptoclostridium litorale DSM 5388 TaxID=1121324 RepID=A0A069RRK1_PEPLI|nr:protein-export chaperone SecB [Peptoclostridium litorale]KDR96807.1 hypothetical protein CLIT_20p00200 [Peptoclostridium litorale DSM 5388]SIO36383.1 preprotein translocase subunit SecB [Peptoclostridium litorale DSM 5388]